jgi:hypothetical protein
MGLDEREDSRPGIIGVCCELLLLTVEEAVRRPFVGDDLVLDARDRECLVQRGVVLGRDVLICARLEREDRRFELGGALRRSRSSVSPFAGSSVETDRT